MRGKKIWRVALLPISFLIFLGGCGQEKEAINAPCSNEIMKLENITEHALIFSDLDEFRTHIIHIAKFSKNRFENNIQAVVSDGTYSITLGMHLDDLIYDEEPLPWDETDWVIGRVYFEDYWFCKRKLPYNDFTVFSVNCNFYVGDIYGTYNNYIYAIQLETPRFETAAGVKVGMTVEELKEAYGERLAKFDDDYIGDGISYYQYFSYPLVFDFYVREGIIESIFIEAMGIEVANDMMFNNIR